MLFYFTECWDLLDDDADNDTLVALTSITADYDDDTVANSTLDENTQRSVLHNAEDNDGRERWHRCYDGFFDKLVDEFAKIMGFDEKFTCCGGGSECSTHSSSQEQM